MIVTSKFSLHFMEVVKRKSVITKLMAFVKNSTQSLNSMVIIGMHTLIFFPMKMPIIHLEGMMTKIKLIFTVKEIRDYNRQHLQYYRTEATMLKSSGKVIGIHLLKIVLKSKPTFHNFVPSLTFKRSSPKTKLFNTSKTDIYLDSSNVTFTHLNTSRITFQK